MSYTIALQKYHTSRRPQSISRRFHDAREQFLLGAGICAVVLLMALYVAEANALMFLERSIPVKESIVLETKGSVQGLEIQATQLQSSQTVQAAALSKEMVFKNSVSYVSAGDTSVAMAKTSR